MCQTVHVIATQSKLTFLLTIEKRNNVLSLYMGSASI